MLLEKKEEPADVEDELTEQGEVDDEQDEAEEGDDAAEFDTSDYEPQEETLESYIAEHPEEEDPIVGDEAPILMVDFPDMMEPIIPWTTEYNLRADSWARKPNESMLDYAERFYQEILSVIPYEETYQ